tara:strand:- start:520 stop:723 length:204 start_codon:yes stop_codon:yes gene_type:complete
MVKTVLLIMLMLNNGQVEFITSEVSVCPTRAIVEMKYEKLKEQGAFHDWSALCFDVNFAKKTKRLKV